MSLRGQYLYPRAVHDDIRRHPPLPCIISKGTDRQRAETFATCSVPGQRGFASLCLCTPLPASDMAQVGASAVADMNVFSILAPLPDCPDLNRFLRPCSVSRVTPIPARVHGLIKPHTLGPGKGEWYFHLVTLSRVRSSR